MTNWQMFAVMGISNWNDSDGGFGTSLSLDKHIEYRDGYSKNFWTTLSFLPMTCGRSVGNRYVEIDLDETKYREMHYVFRGNVIREVPQEVAISRNMISASSVNPTALAITREGMDRVDRGEKADFKYQIEDNGVKHSWVYKKN